MSRVSFPGVKQPGYGIDHPPPFNVSVKEKIELAVPLLPLWAFVASSVANFTFFV
jgi:hypothetical protein